jgi:hypothetical protein
LQQSINHANEAITSSNDYILNYYVGSNQDLLLNLTDLRNHIWSSVHTQVDTNNCKYYSDVHDKLKLYFLRLSNADKANMCNATYLNNLVTTTMNSLFPTNTNVLAANTILRSSDTINYLVDGNYRLYMQPDGKLISYYVPPPPGGWRILFNIQTNTTKVGDYILGIDSAKGLYVAQEIVAVDRTYYNILWQNKVAVGKTNPSLVLKNGQLYISAYDIFKNNLVYNFISMIYDDRSSTQVLNYMADRTILSTQTINYIQNGDVQIVMQNDGNLVLLFKGTTNVWSTGTGTTASAGTTYTLSVDSTNGLCITKTVNSTNTIIWQNKSVIGMLYPRLNISTYGILFLSAIQIDASGNASTFVSTVYAQFNTSISSDGVYAIETNSQTPLAMYTGLEHIFKNSIYSASELMPKINSFAANNLQLLYNSIVPNINKLILLFINDVCPNNVFSVDAVNRLIDGLYNLTCGSNNQSSNIIQKAIDYTLGTYGKALINTPTTGPVGYHMKFRDIDGPTVNSISCPTGQSMHITNYYYASTACPAIDYATAANAKISGNSLNVNYPNQIAITGADPCPGYDKAVDMSFTCG